VGSFASILIVSVSAKIGCTAQTLLEWVKKAEVDSDQKLNSDGHSPPIRRYRRVSRKFLERWDWVVGHSATLEILSAPDQVKPSRPRPMP
jgi:hypothetical protein